MGSTAIQRHCRVLADPRGPPRPQQEYPHPGQAPQEPHTPPWPCFLCLWAGDRPQRALWVPPCPPEATLAEQLAWAWRCVARLQLLQSCHFFPRSTCRTRHRGQMPWISHVPSAGAANLLLQEILFTNLNTVSLLFLHWQKLVFLCYFFTRKPCSGFDYLVMEEPLSHLRNKEL